MLVRLGIPASFPRFTAAADAIGAPTLISANAMRKDGKFRRLKPGAFSGDDVALDSAGFVAMVRYGGFPWSIGEYIDLAASYPWSWWAAMDLCCEPQIARDADVVEERIAGTARLLADCQAAADERGIRRPMPVIQGWTPDQYERCAGMLGDLPPLVGVGSVCRRQIKGPAGLMAVVQRLDRVLPRSTSLHLFGVKSTGLSILAGHPRVASIDSMAWDFAARRDKSAAYTVDHRISHMRRWYAAQQGRLASSASLFA